MPVTVAPVDRTTLENEPAPPVIEDDPVLMVPKFDVIEPESRAPTLTRPVAVVTLFWVAVESVPASVVPDTVPVVVMAPLPTSMDVNPDVIEPAFRAPTLTRPVAVVTLFWVAVERVPASVVAVTTLSLSSTESIVTPAADVVSAIVSV
tara:strand:+ start:293 stop:739 length:447 start_codon:yes stop_codon:yes gene_type:complete